jgi:AcrR family transcriptional regulator
MTSTRLTCAERREAVLEAALAEFAAHGYEGSSTEEIVRRVGISQPYVFRLFGTKRDLFKAGVRCCLTETLEAFERAAAGKRGRHVLNAIAASNRELLRTRPRLLGRLQASAACDDPELREIVRAGYGELVAFVERASGLPAEQVADFFARGMLIDFLTAIDLDSRPEPWSRNASSVRSGQMEARGSACRGDRRLAGREAHA